MQNLPTAPLNIIDAHGQPKFGHFVGQTTSINWSTLATPYARNKFWRYFHHKRWQYIALASAQVFCGIAIVDIGWASTAFAYVFDRQQRKQIAGFSRVGLPRMSAIHVSDTPDGKSSFHSRHHQIHYQPGTQDKPYQLQLISNQFTIDAEFTAVLPVLLAVGPVHRGSVHATQKSSAMPLKGTLSIGTQRYDLTGGVASLDYSNGLLARHTSWCWASGHTLDIGFNLQSGYFGQQENALWLDGKLYALGNACFDYQNALAPWHIYTDDGLLDLYFMPLGARKENKSNLLVTSRYIQPIGYFDGWVKPVQNAAPRIVKQIIGITEEHFARW